MNSMMHSEGWASDLHPNYTLVSECVVVTSNDLQPGTTSTSSIFYKYRNSLTDLTGFKYFTGVDILKDYLFYDCTNVTKIEFPNSITRTDRLVYGSTGLINVKNIDLSATRLSVIDRLIDHGTPTDNTQNIFLPSNTITINQKD